MFWRKRAVELPSDPRVGGLIGYYGLDSWWSETFSPDERAFIEEKWQPSGGGSVRLTTGTLQSTDQPVAVFLHQLAGWFKRTDQVHLGVAMLRKASATIGNCSATDQHFYYQTYIELRYKQRVSDPSAVLDVIAACEAMIALAPAVAEEMRARYGPLVADGGGVAVPPRHKGYEQLITLRNKQGDKAGAARLKDEFERVWRD